MSCSIVSRLELTGSSKNDEVVLTTMLFDQRHVEAGGCTMEGIGK